MIMWVRDRKMNLSTVAWGHAGHDYRTWASISSKKWGDKLIYMCICKRKHACERKAHSSNGVGSGARLRAWGNFGF